jgi:hypothetical protein
MPIINAFDPGDVDPLINIAGTSPMSLSGDVSKRLKVHIVGTSPMFLTPRMDFGPSILIPGTSTLFAHGRLNGESNVFGSIEIPGTSAMALTGRVKNRAKVVIAGTSSMILRPRVSIADRAVLTLLVTVVPAAPGPTDAGRFGDTISARVVADGVTYPIRSASYSEPKDAAGVTMQFVLQKPGDRDAILAASSFKFDIYVGGAWNTIFDAGRRSGSGFAFAWVDARPDDSLEVSTIGPVSDAITRTPTESVTVYDGLRETLSVDEFPTIYDTDGYPHRRTLINIPGLTLYALLRSVFVDTLGFTNYITDIPNYAIRRADFEVTGTYLSGVAPFIGMFDPLIFVRNNVVWILDSTQKIPAGFAAPYPLNGSDYKTAALRETEIDADGYLVTYADAAEFDYSTDREVIDPVDTTSDPYTEIHRTRTYRDFYKISNPFVPVGTEKVKEVEDIRARVGGSLLTVQTATETINLDSTGRFINIDKDVTALIPDITNPLFPLVTQTTRSERTDFTYTPVLRNSNREFLSQTKRVVRGLIVTDSDNEHLGKPFKQEFVNGWRAGNLSDSQSIDFGDIELFVETVRETDRGQLEIRARTVDYLTTPAVVHNTTTDARAGDLSTNARGGTPQQTIVLKQTGFTRSNRKLLPLSVGELPIVYAVPLARRRLANPVQRSGSVALKGLRLQFGRGFVFELFNRDGGSVGTYIVEGRTITLNNLGTREQATTQSLDVLQI